MEGEALEKRLVFCDQSSQNKTNNVYPAELTRVDPVAVLLAVLFAAWYTGAVLFAARGAIAVLLVVWDGGDVGQ